MKSTCWPGWVGFLEKKSSWNSCRPCGANPGPRPQWKHEIIGATGRECRLDVWLLPKQQLRCCVLRHHGSAEKRLPWAKPWPWSLKWSQPTPLKIGQGSLDMFVTVCWNLVRNTSWEMLIFESRGSACCLKFCQSSLEGVLQCWTKHVGRCWEFGASCALWTYRLVELVGGIPLYPI